MRAWLNQREITVKPARWAEPGGRKAARWTPGPRRVRFKAETGDIEFAPGQMVMLWTRRTPGAPPGAQHPVLARVERVFTIGCGRSEIVGRVLRPAPRRGEAAGGELPGDIPTAF